MTINPTAPVISASVQVLAHVPGMARHGSKPLRELPSHPDREQAFLGALRTFDDAVSYPPHQVFVGAVHPRQLPERPWVAGSAGGASRFGPSGELMPELEFLGLLTAVD
ncbi:MAG: glycine reductase, partial [Actinomycetota bacterium]|nr:glycine reductase [Actinomycetota bacterium]